jgi:hypothetical protein
MRILTLFSAFFLPLTFLVGVYGMNFEYMPELSWRWGYPAVWVVMVIITLVILHLVPPPGLAQAVIVALLALALGITIGWYARTRIMPAMRRPPMRWDRTCCLIPRSSGSGHRWARWRCGRRGGAGRPAARGDAAPLVAAADEGRPVHRRGAARPGARGGAAPGGTTEAGVLVVRSASGFATAALMPPGTPSHAVTQLEDELDRLLEGLKRRPRVTALAPADGRDAHIESIESVGRQLALLLEKLTGADVIVAIRIRMNS